MQRNKKAPERSGAFLLLQFEDDQIPLPASIPSPFGR